MRSATCWTWSREGAGRNPAEVDALDPFGAVTHPSHQVCPVCGSALQGGVRPEFCPVCLLREAVEPGAPRPFLPEGMRRLGDYDLLGEVARGGMGVVFRARQRSLGRIVAVKLLLGGHFAGEAASHRFREEAAAAAALQHPHIVAIHEVGEHEGQPFFSMDFVEGRTLAEMVKEGPLGVRRAAQLVSVIARAVGYAHRQGVLHRDLKPSNVIVDPFDQPRVTDFGLAKRLESGVETLTATGQILGSPAYASPEQVQGSGVVGPAGDVYSLGALLYHLLTGRAPFQAETLPALLRQVAGEDPVSPRRLNPSVSRDLDTLCLKCLEKEPGRRYAGADCLADDLDRFLAGRPVLARPVGWVGRGWRWSVRHRLVASLGLLLALALAGLTLGSTVAVLRIAGARHAAERSLRQALLDEARALRLGGNVLGREEILDRVRQVVALDGEGVDRVRARSEATAALALPEVAFEEGWRLPPDAAAEFLWYDAESGTRFEVVGETRLRIEEAGGIERFLDTGNHQILALESVTSDRRHVALRHPAGVGVWDVAGGGRVYQGQRPRGVVAFAAAGDFAVLEESHDGLVVVDLPGGTIRSRPQVPDPIPNGDRGWFSIVPSPDGRWLAGGRVRTNVADILRVADGRHVARVFPGEAATAAAWNPAGRGMLAVGTSGGRILVLRQGGGEGTEWGLDFLLPAEQSGVEHLCFSHGGARLAAGTVGHVVSMFELITRRRLFSVPAQARGLGFNPEGERLGPMIRDRAFQRVVVRPSTLIQDREIPNLRPEVLGIDFGDRTPFAAVHAFSRGMLIHGRTGRMLTRLNTAGTRELRLHPGGGAVYGVDGRGVSRWEVRPVIGDEYEVGDRFPLRPGPGWGGLAFSRDGRRMALAARDRGCAVLLEAPFDGEGIEVGTHPGVEGVALSPDARWLATTSPLDRRIRVWEIDTGKAVREWVGGRRPQAAFSSDGRWFLAAGLRCSLIAVDGWRQVAVPGLEPGSEAGVAAFSGDSRWLAVAIQREEVQLFALPALREVLTLHAPRGNRITALGFGPMGQTLLAGGVENSIQVWRLDRLRELLKPLGLDWDPTSPVPVVEEVPDLRVRILPQTR